MSSGKDAARDLIYGRRGGRWLPKSKPRSDKPAPEKNLEVCRICGKAYGNHSGEICPLCGRAVEHHAPGDVELELEARARMADARRHARLELSALDLEALETFPHFEVLTPGDGYQ